MNAYYDTIDLQLFLESELMPTATTTSTNAATELAKLTANNLSPIAVADLASCVKTTADSAVLGMAKCLVRGTYQVKVSSSAYNTSSHVWSGKLTVTNYGDETDTATHSSNISITINGDLETYIKQKINRMINQTESDPTDISALFNAFDFINVSKFAERIGLSPSLMRHYKGGDTYISDNQAKRIEAGLHQIARELLSVTL